MGHHQSAYQLKRRSAIDKSYVCYIRQIISPSRYVELQNLALTAFKEKKIFSIFGNCSAVRKALLERGWVEKIPPVRINLSKIGKESFTNQSEIHSELERLLLSHLVEKFSPNFIWRFKKEQLKPGIEKPMVKKGIPVTNKLKTDAVWTTKQGLCSSIKRNYWFYIEDVAEVNSPRTYNSYEVGEIEAFIKDYKITACTSLLKFVLYMVANNKPLFVKSGTVSINVLVFVLNRCKEYLLRKQHKDIDRLLNTTSDGQWNSFLKKFYRIIGKQDLFQEDKDNKLPLYLSYAKFLLQEIHKFRPQLSCEGCHNIWIIKPACCSRGRGIRMASTLEVITNLLNKAYAKYVVQKYIEEPLLIHDTKFDIRQYYLVTSTFPLVIWMYTDCYLKFSSQIYSLRNYHESIHLTNYAVQRNYKNSKKRHSELPQNNMWDSEMYKDYLKKIGKREVWDTIIYPGMKKSIIAIMLSCQESLTASKKRFELYGCDFVLDQEYKPWLIEINSDPDLNHTTQVTAKICSAVVSDIIKVVVDYASNTNSSTGKFECIYRQATSILRHDSAAPDLAVRGYALPLNYFYRGNVIVKESYDDPDIGKEYNIKEVLNKLKHYYDTMNIVVPADNDDTTPSKHSNESLTCGHNTESENELTVAVSIINEQLDDILDRITIENSFNSELDETLCAPFTLSSENHQLKDKHSMQCMVDITTTKESLHLLRVASLETINIEQSFNELGDGPQVDVDCANTNSSAEKLECMYRQPLSIPRYGNVANITVGYTLPLGYFHQRNLKIKKSYDNQDLGKQRDNDIKTIFEKLKHFYEINLMVLPDNDDKTPSKDSYVPLTCDYNTESKNELTVESIITEQLEEIINRFTSENSFSSQSDDAIYAHSSINHQLKVAQHKQCMTDIQATKESLQLLRFSALELISIKPKFSFSELDDDPYQSSSFDEFDPNDFA